MHLAGIATTDHSDISVIYSANVVGTANLFGALAAVNIEPQIVFVATELRCTRAKGRRAAYRDSPLAPQSHYAVSKHTVEDIARIYSSRFPSSSPGRSIIPARVGHRAFSFPRSSSTTRKEKAKFD